MVAIAFMHQDTIEFWKGQFGDDYCVRNNFSRIELSQRITFWAKVLSKIHDETSLKKILEVGCNIGLNIESLKVLLDSEYFGIEPNEKARETAQKHGILDAAHLFNGSSRSLPFPDASFNFVFTSAVLIHVAPSELEISLREIHRVSDKYILCSEYFSDTPTEVAYRGHSGVLFKQDYGSLYLDLFPDLKLVDYGFEWRRVTGLDNMNWWLFKKANS